MYYSGFAVLHPEVFCKSLSPSISIESSLQHHHPTPTPPKKQKSAHKKLDSLILCIGTTLKIHGGETLVDL